MLGSRHDPQHAESHAHRHSGDSVRHHGTLLTRIWNDPEFLALSHSAKGTYMMLLSQPKLSMCGVLDYMPERWAGYSPDTTGKSIAADLAALEAARFIIVDRSTYELAIRTMVKNDPPKNPNSAVGMWKAWAHIASEPIRRALTAEMPPMMWEDNRAPDEAHEMAAQNSCETVSEPLAEQSETQPEVDPLPPTTIHLPPSTVHRPPAVAQTVRENSRSSRVSSETADVLTAVWSAWRSTRRSGRDKCERSIAKALKADHDPTAIIDGARRWAAHYDREQTEDQYVPMLTTWLNDQRWLMDTPTPRQAHPSAHMPTLSKGAQIALDLKARLAQQAERTHGNVIDLPAIGSGT